MNAPLSDEYDYASSDQGEEDHLQSEVDKSRYYRLQQRASYASPQRKQGAHDEARRLEGTAYNHALAVFSGRIQAISAELIGEKELLPTIYSKQLISELVERIGAIVDELTNYLENNHEPLYPFVYHDLGRSERVEHVVDLGTAVGKLLEAYTDQTYSRFEARTRLQRLIASLEGLDPNGSAKVG
jgi:hypothetical protein